MLPSECEKLSRETHNEKWLKLLIIYFQNCDSLGASPQWGGMPNRARRAQIRRSLSSLRSGHVEGASLQESGPGLGERCDQDAGRPTELGPARPPWASRSRTLAAVRPGPLPAAAQGASMEKGAICEMLRPHSRSSRHNPPPQDPSWAQHRAEAPSLPSAAMP